MYIYVHVSVCVSHMCVSQYKVYCKVNCCLPYMSSSGYSNIPRLLKDNESLLHRRVRKQHYDHICLTRRSPHFHVISYILICIMYYELLMLFTDTMTECVNG